MLDRMDCLASINQAYEPYRKLFKRLGGNDLVGEKGGLDSLLCQS